MMQAESEFARQASPSIDRRLMHNMSTTSTAEYNVDRAEDRGLYSTTAAVEAQPYPAPTSPSLSDVEYRNTLKDSIGSPVSEKKSSGLLRRSSLAKSSEIKKSSELKKSQYSELKKSTELKKSGELKKSWNPFKRSTSEIKKKDDLEDEQIMQQLYAEGKTDDEIAAYICKQQEIQVNSSPVPERASTPKSGGVGGWFKSIQQALKEEFSVRRSGEEEIDPLENRTRFLTVNISSAPFYGAVPEGTDLNFDELAKIESVYQNESALCINNLPITKYDGNQLPSQQSTCPICITDPAW